MTVHDAAAAAAPAPRLPRIDAARGIAIVAMATYHFAWDLRFVGFIAADIGAELGWRIYARSIAASFLFLVGLSLVLAQRHDFDAGRFLRRLAVIAAAALAVTVVTRLAFPQSYIFFGILHCIALASVLGLPFLRAPVIVTAATGVLCLLAPRFWAGPAFDAPALLWLGLADFFPRTNDYVPLLPWFGAVLAGVAAARLLPALPRWRGFLARGAPWPLVWAGRHSLAIYLIHQPLLFGLVWLAAQVAPPPRDDVFMQSCTTSCADSEVDAKLCTRICACLAERSKAEGLWDGILQNTLTEEQRMRYFDLAATCQGEAAP